MRDELRLGRILRLLRLVRLGVLRDELRLDDDREIPREELREGLALRALDPLDFAPLDRLPLLRNDDRCASAVTVGHMNSPKAMMNNKNFNARMSNSS